MTGTSEQRGLTFFEGVTSSDPYTTIYVKHYSPNEDKNCMRFPQDRIVSILSTAATTEHTPLSLGLGTSDFCVERYLDPKEIVQTAAPKDVVHLPTALIKRNIRGVNFPRNERFEHVKIPTMPVRSRADIKERKIAAYLRDLSPEKREILYQQERWSTTARRQQKEVTDPFYKTVTPPNTTYEEKADMLKRPRSTYPPYDYYSEGDHRMWDRLQNRSPIRRPDIMKSLIDEPDYKERRPVYKCVDISEEMDRIIALDRADKLAGFAKRPPEEYGGHIPAHAPKNSIEKQPTPPRWVNPTVNSDYRRHPALEPLDRERKHRKKSDLNTGEHWKLFVGSFDSFKNHVCQMRCAGSGDNKR